MTENQQIFVDRPRQINTTEFIQQRALEISQLMAVLKNADLPAGEVAQGPRTFIQRLPRHMRRRAMAYNAKRMPRYRRSLAVEGMSDRRPRKKPPSRHFKRRPTNLARAYGRRVGKSRWLETHIWHARRFWMRERHGFKVAFKSYQRSFRATYRDFMRHCVVRDESFFSRLCFEASREEIIRSLDDFCCSDVGLTLKAVAFSDGRRRGSVVLYAPGRYPYGCLGVFDFMWQPETRSQVGSNSKLWIWTHPSAKNLLVSCIIDRLKLKKSSIIDTREFCRCDLYISDDDTGLKMYVHSNDFAKFKLTGPLATAILHDTLKRPKIDNMSSFSPNVENFTLQWDFWSVLQQSQVVSGAVIPLVVEDPRFYTDYKKALPTKVYNNDWCKAGREKPNLSSSPLWDDEVVEKVCKSKISESNLNNERSKMMKIGLELNNDNLPPDSIPIILVFFSKNDQIYDERSKFRTAFPYSGYDLIIPSRWARPFWLALQYRTCRAIGSESSDKICFETDNLMFPDFWPDTECGKLCETDLEKEMSEVYLRRPHNRRTRYTKLKIKYPFRCAWQELLSGWNHEQSTEDEKVRDFYVLRDRRKIRLLKNLLSGKRNDSASSDLENFWSEDALVPVKIVSLGKGVPGRFAAVYLPQKGDLANLNSQLKLFEVDFIKVKTRAVDGDIADTTIDQNFVTVGRRDGKIINMNQLFADRRAEKLAKRKLAQKMKKKRRKLHKKGNADDKNSVSDRNEDINDQSFSINIVDYCKRKTMGFIVEGDYALSIGYGKGLGYCSMLALKQLIADIPVAEIHGAKFRPILYRNSTSKCYRLAIIDIIES